MLSAFVCHTFSFRLGQCEVLGFCLKFACDCHITSFLVLRPFLLLTPDHEYSEHFLKERSLANQAVELEVSF